MKNKQYFYLVGITSKNFPETYVVPNKITLQEYDAIKYGRRLATELRGDSLDSKVRLYRQSITRNGCIEFVKELLPFNSELSHFGSFNKSDEHYHIIHWLSGGSVLIHGKNEVDAMNKAGIGAGAIKAIDWIEILETKDFIETPTGKIYILKNKQVGGLLQPQRSNEANVNGRYPYCTGIIFSDDTRQIETYPTDSQARIDWEYLKKVLF